jgi:Flp pilus assembly protein CpaB
LPKKEYPTTTPDWQAAVKRRTRFYVLMAVLLAILFGILVYQFFSDQQQNAPGVLTSAVFASRDIDSGLVLTDEMLVVREVSSKGVPESHLSHEEQAIGKLALYPLVDGEVILPEKLAGDQGSALAQRCPIGKWCVSIPISWFIASPPDLSVGDRIAIASSLSGRNMDETGFIAANVQVVVMPGMDDFPAYIFALDDQEALSVLYARVNEFQLLVLLRPAGS